MTESTESLPTQGNTESFVPKDLNGLRGVDPHDILQRIAEGELLRDVALTYGVSVPAVSRWISRNVPKQTWDSVRELSIAARLEQAIAEFDHVKDGIVTIDKDGKEREGNAAWANVNLACAREKAKLWMWRAEREFPHIYASKPMTSVNIGGEGIQVNLVSYSQHAAPLSTDVTDSTDNPDSK